VGCLADFVLAPDPETNRPGGGNLRRKQAGFLGDVPCPVGVNIPGFPLDWHVLGADKTVENATWRDKLPLLLDINKALNSARLVKAHFVKGSFKAVSFEGKRWGIMLKLCGA